MRQRRGRRNRDGVLRARKREHVITTLRIEKVRLDPNREGDQHCLTLDCGIGGAGGLGGGACGKDPSNGAGRRSITYQKEGRKLPTIEVSVIKEDCFVKWAWEIVAVTDVRI